MSSVRRLGPASIASPGIFGFGKLLAALAAAISLASCNTPTQVSVVVTSDLPCKRLKGVRVWVGTVDTLEKKPHASETTLCKDITGGSEIGEVVLIPRVEKNDEFAIKVVAGVDTAVDQCGKMGNYTGCIVARRSLNFIPQTALHLPIFLSRSCEGVACTPEPCEGMDCPEPSVETCVLGECVPAAIPDPKLCVNAEACEDNVLTGPANPPPPPGPVECGRPSVLVDDFQTETENLQWSVEPISKVGVSQVAGQLTFTPPVDAAAPTELRYRSKRAVNLSRDAITVQVPTALKKDSGIRTYLAAELDAANRLMIEHTGGTLRFVSIDAAGTPAEESVTYNPKAHIWWEIRATSSNIIMRTSPNGIDWEPGATFARPAFADFAHIVLGAGVDGPLMGPDSVSFDNLNQGRPQATWCPINTFSDDFEAPTPSPKWKLETKEACTLKHEDGNLVLEIPAGIAGACIYQSRTAFDLRDNSLVLDLQELTDISSDMSFFLRAKDDAGAELQIGVTADGAGTKSFFGLRRSVGGIVMPVYAPFDATPKLLRIREADGQVFLETNAPNAMTWDAPPVLQDTVNLVAEAVDVTLHLEVFVPLGQTLAAKIGHVNP
jgi:hypothetical protein